MMRMRGGVSSSLLLVVVVSVAFLIGGADLRLRRRHNNNKKRWHDHEEAEYGGGDGSQENYHDHHDEDMVANDDPSDYAGEGGQHDEADYHAVVGAGDEAAATTSAITGAPVDEATTPSPCRSDELVKCLSDPLDDWANTLYSLKENIVAISSDECLGVREELRKCVEVRSQADFQCSHKDMLQVTARVTDLLVHKRESGNLLRSYYVTEYVCGDEGKAIRDSIDDACLKQEHIGKMTMEAIEHMDKKLSNNHTAPNKERCDFLRDRSHLLRSIANQKCADHQPIEAGLLMCETVKMTFLKMHPDMFAVGGSDGNNNLCQFECKHTGAGTDAAPSEAVENGSPTEEDGNSSAGKPDANHAGGQTNGQQGGDGGENGSPPPIWNNWRQLVLAFTTTAVLTRLLQ